MLRPFCISATEEIRRIRIQKLVIIGFVAMIGGIGPTSVVGQTVDSLGYVIPRALSEDGSVVVGMIPIDPEQDGRAFYWTDSSGVVEIAPVRAGFPNSAIAVSADGKSIIGQEGYDDFKFCKPNALDYDPSKARRPFIKDGSGIRLLDPGTPWCYDVWDASSDGSVVVGVFEDTTSGLNLEPRRAFKWEGSFIDLHDVAYGATLARGVSGDGNIVVGNALTFGQPTTAVLYNGGAQTLFEGIAFDANVDGSIIVGSRLNGPTVKLSGGQETNLGGTSGDAFISDDGSVIVFNTSVAMIWTEASGKTESLLNYLNQRGAVPPNWTFSFATGISGDGQYAVGWDFFGGSIHGWRVSLGKKLKIKRPEVDDLYVAGTQDTLSWDASGVDKVDIYLSTDRSLSSLRSIVTGFPADSGMYVWSVPDSLSRTATIVIEDASDPTVADTSDIFRIKGYVLTRVDQNGDYEAFDTALHGWSFPNSRGWLDPPTYQNTNQFRYYGPPFPGTDPFTSSPYEQDEFIGLGVTPISFFDYPSVVRAFGTDRFYFGPPALRIYRNNGLDFWAARTSPRFAGACSGMSISAIMAFARKDLFAIAFPSIGQVDEINSVVSGPSVPDAIREVVNTLFVYWDGRLAQDHLDSHRFDTPRQTLQYLKDALLDRNENFASIGYVYINNLGSWPTRAHAVAPIRLTRTSVSPNVWDLTIYDPNAPNVERTIRIDSTANTWSYLPRYNGSGRVYMMDPHWAYYGQSLWPDAGRLVDFESLGKDENEIEVFPPSFATVSITGSGGSVGYADSVAFNNLEGAFENIVPTGYPSSPVSYRLPAASYRAVVSNFPDTTSNFSVDLGDVRYAAVRTDAAPSDTDHYAVGEGLSIRNADPVEKTFLVRTIRVGDDDERSFIVSDLQLGADDSVTVQHGSDHMLVVDNGPSARSYEAVVRRGMEGSVVRYRYGPIAMGAAQRYGLAPDWDDIGDSLKVLIDFDRDGTWDDSMYVAYIATGVEDKGGTDVLPTQVALYQNYPNPFNPTTTITFSLPEHAHVRLAVYDVTGRLVQSVADGHRSAGVHEVRFDASGLPSGTYYYRLEAGGHVETKRMMLLK